MPNSTENGTADSNETTGTIYRDGFEVSPNYWGAGGNEKSPDEIEESPQEIDSKPATDKKITHQQENIRDQIRHPLEGNYGCP